MRDGVLIVFLSLLTFGSIAIGIGIGIRVTESGLAGQKCHPNRTCDDPKLQCLKLSHYDHPVCTSVEDLK